MTDAQSFYNSGQVSISKRYTHNLFWQVSYTLAHSIDDASVDFSVESVNDPPASQNIFDRKGSRGRSSFDIRHNFVANAAYQLPGADVYWAAGRSRLLPAFIAGPHLPRCSPLTMPTCNRCLFRNAQTLLATLMRESVRTEPGWALCRAGLIQVLLRYHRPVSLAMPDEICCGDRGSRNLTQRCTKILQLFMSGRSRLEWKLITCSTIRILAFRVILKVRFPWR